VPVAAAVARAINAPLDVVLVRKLGLPWHSELAMGAIGEGAVRVIDPAIVRLAGLSDGDIASVEDHERRELARRAALFRHRHHGTALAGRTVVVVDDGLATGSTALAACRVVRAQGARRVVLAVPVAPSDVVERLRAVADEVVCLVTPDRFGAVGQYYVDFTPTTDAEVIELLRQFDQEPSSSAVPVTDRDVQVPAGSVTLRGHLTVPRQARGVVIFVHGSGSSHLSPRNRHVARVLNGAGLGTLLFDLLTPREELDRQNVFDIDLLARRLATVTRWVRTQDATAGLPIGFFGASTGGGAALAAAATDPDIAAIVVRGGRPDLAGAALSNVTAPTLLVVGGSDPVVLRLNQAAQTRLAGAELAVVPGATHLFDEPGALDAVAELATGWFLANLQVADRAAR